MKGYKKPSELQVWHRLATRCRRRARALAYKRRKRGESIMKQEERMDRIRVAHELRHYFRTKEALFLRCKRRYFLREIP